MLYYSILLTPLMITYYLNRTMLPVIGVTFLWLLGFLLLWKIPLCRRVTKKAIPPISVIIPARNEEHTLPTLFHSLKNQDLEPDEIIVVNDQSQDGTAQVARRFGAIVAESEDLPAGWLGKPWACWQGAHRAQGDILVFLDADIILEPGGLNKIVTAYLHRRGLVSVWPFHRMKKLYERLSSFFNIIILSSVSAFTLLGSKIKPLGAFGPCMVCSREDYFFVGGHEKVKGAILEDIAFGKLFLDFNREVHCFGGRGAITFRMYPEGIRSLIQGFSKGMATGAKTASKAALIMMICWVAGGFIVTYQLIHSAIDGNISAVLIWSIVNALYILQIYWILFRIGNFGFYTAVFYQVSLLFFTFICFLSLILTRFMKRVYWKGREIRVQERSS